MTWNSRLTRAASALSIPALLDRISAERRKPENISNEELMPAEYVVDVVPDSTGRPVF
jgi:hypothetical protein